MGVCVGVCVYVCVRVSIINLRCYEPDVRNIQRKVEFGVRQNTNPRVQSKATSFEINAGKFNMKSV